MKDRTSLSMIIVEQDGQNVSRLEQVCREAGYDVNALHTNTPDELRDALGRQSWDLILLGSQVTGIDVSQVMAIVSEHNIDASVVVVTPLGDESSIAGLLAAGVRDVVGLDPSDRLKHVIQRETADLRVRRELKRHKRVLKEYERRLLYFLGRSEKRQVKSQVVRDTPLQNDAADPAVSPAQKDNATGQETQTATPVSADRPVPVKDADGRNSVLEELTRVLTADRRQTGYLALLYIELDMDRAPSDPQVTETYLADVEKRLREALMQSTFMSRFENFVFLALISHEDRHGLVKAVHSIKQAIEGMVIQAGGAEVKPACSIGVCLADQHMRRASGLIANAKAACKKAADGGGKRVCFSGTAVPKAPEKQPVSMPVPEDKPVPVSMPPAQETVKDGWGARIQAALNENRFTLVFQPVVHFHAAPTETYEILLRMVDEKGGEIMPDEFIPKAEQSGLMQEIDRWVVKTAASALQQRQVSGSSTRLFVKLSAASIQSPEFPPWLEEMLQGMQLPTEGLVFQLSEPLADKDMSMVREFTRRLTTMGCSTALDHFGLQKDSLETAKTLPVKYLKLHGKLIQDLARDVSSQRLLKDIVDTARASGKVTIASFVQDPYILSILWRCRVDYVQGFYFQPPKAAMAYDFTSAVS